MTITTLCGTFPAYVLIKIKLKDHQSIAVTADYIRFDSSELAIIKGHSVTFVPLDEIEELLVLPSEPF